MPDPMDISSEISQLVRDGQLLIKRLEAQETTRLIYGKFTITDAWTLRGRELIRKLNDLEGVKNYDLCGFINQAEPQTDEECFAYTVQMIRARILFLLTLQQSLTKQQTP